MRFNRKPEHDELRRKIAQVAIRGLKVTDQQIANAAGASRTLIKNLRQRMHLSRLTPTRKYSGTEKERNLQAVKLYRSGKPDVDRRCQANQRAYYKIRILEHYGPRCAVPGCLSPRLELNHVHGDGKWHRLAIGSGMLTVYRFVWRVITKGPQTDRFGKTWNESDFNILCRSHNARGEQA